MNKTCKALPLVLCAWAISAEAEELWTPHFSGIQNGYSTGALPPHDGLYFINTTDYASVSVYGSNGKSTGSKLDAVVDIPELAWVTPWKVLGADYAVAIAQPWDHIDLKPDLPPALTAALEPLFGSSPTISKSGWYATFLTPAVLSWHLPEHFFLAFRTDVYVPDGGWQNPLAHGVAGHLNSLGFYSLEPSLAVSWLNDGWNVSVKLWYDHNFRDLHTDYTSGDAIGTEFTAAKSIGKWSVGLTGYTKTQIANDKGATYQLFQEIGLAGPNGNRYEDYAVGPTAGYNFGPVILNASLDHSLSVKNGAGGDQFFTRLIVPLF